MVESAKKEGGLTLYASNVICTRISPVTGSFSYGSSLREREMCVRQGRVEGKSMCRGYE